jgi:hypothetical protein
MKPTKKTPKMSAKPKGETQKPTVILVVDENTFTETNRDDFRIVLLEMIGFKKYGKADIFVAAGENSEQSVESIQHIGIQTKNVFKGTFDETIYAQNISEVTGAPLDTVLIVNCSTPDKVAAFKNEMKDANIVQTEKETYSFIKNMKEGFDTAAENCAAYVPV